MQKQKADVVVVGAGAVGAMALWQLSQIAGLNVVGVEQYGRVHAFGSYTGESRVFRTAYHEGGIYVPLIQASRGLWRELEKQSGRDIFYEVGTLSIAPEGFPDLLQAQQTVQDFDLPHRLLDTGELREQYPQHLVADGEVGLLDMQGGGMRPEVAVASALRVAERNGARLLFNTPVIGIEEHAATVTVRTEQGAISARTVVVAGGSWAGRLRPELHELLRLQVLGLTWLLPERPELYTPDRFPAFLRDRDGIHFFGAPSFDGFSFKACSNPEWSVMRDVSEVPRDHTRRELIKIGQRALELFDRVGPEPVRQSVHHCAYTPNRQPIVDRSGQVVTVAGLSGHGFKFAPQLGRWAAELAADVTVGRECALPDSFSLASHREYFRVHGPYRGGGH